MIKVTFPNRVVAPIGWELYLEYEVEGARRVQVDHLDPSCPAYEAPHRGQVYALACLEPQIVRLAVEDYLGGRSSWSAIVEGYAGDANGVMVFHP